MARFKTGDRVRIKRACSGTKVGEIYTVDDEQELVRTDPSQEGGCSCTKYWELVTNEIITMNLKERFALAFKDEPERSFIKAGIMDTKGELTTEGRDIWTAFLVKKFGAEFKTEVVDKLLATEEPAK